MNFGSAIGIKENGVYKMVYCLLNNGLEYNGSILYCYYNSFVQAKELIELGTLTMLGKHISKPNKPLVDPYGYSNYFYFSNYPTQAFHRDHNFDYCPAIEIHSLEQLREVEYIYYFDKELNEWYVKDMVMEEIYKLEDEIYIS